MKPGGPFENQVGGRVVGHPVELMLTNWAMGYARVLGAGLLAGAGGASVPQRVCINMGCLLGSNVPLAMRTGPETGSGRERIHVLSWVLPVDVIKYPDQSSAQPRSLEL